MASRKQKELKIPRECFESALNVTKAYYGYKADILYLLKAWDITRTCLANTLQCNRVTLLRWQNGIQEPTVLQVEIIRSFAEYTRKYRAEHPASQGATYIRIPKVIKGG